tara:strand:- start:335 stop:1081 length:747 start_codon:yes stop_codon:yes gene_type:complete
VNQSNLRHEDRQRAIALGKKAVEYFNEGDWQALGAYTGELQLIKGHDRLLRSLSFGDPDYTGNAIGMIVTIVERNYENLHVIAQYVAENYGEEDSISTAPSRSKALTFRPSVFEVPDDSIDQNLIAVMTPFAPGFEPVFDTIRLAASASGYKVLRAKDIWEHSAVIQDVFSLIFRSHIVVCDFSGKNPNVFYEAGIAHTLGKHVVPITQSSADIPFDLQHHRYYPYLNNTEGRSDLENALTSRFRVLR